MAYRAEWITDEDRFRALAEQWDRLAARDASPFSLHRWYLAWWEAFGEGNELRTLVLWDEDELAGAIPMCMVGRELQLLANSHTPVTRPLYADDTALDALTAEVFGARERSLFCRLPVSEPAGTALLEGAQRAGRLTVVEEDQTSPFVDLSGSWEEYRERMKSRWSSSERKGRKMAREHVAVFTMVEKPSDLDTQLERGFAVEGSGWKGRAGTAIVSHPETERFYRLIARGFHEQGELAISEIMLDGRCVAFDLCLLHRGRLHLLKTGFDESFGTLSPGLVLRQQVVQRCFELGLETHELLGDDSEWKRRFSTGMRPHMRLQAVRKTPAGIARFGYRKLARPGLRSIYRAVKAARS